MKICQSTNYQQYMHLLRCWTSQQFYENSKARAGPTQELFNTIWFSEEIFVGRRICPLSETLKMSMSKYFDTNWSKERDYASRPGWCGTLSVFSEPNNTTTFVHFKLRTKKLWSAVLSWSNFTFPFRLTLTVIRLFARSSLRKLIWLTRFMQTANL